MEIFRLFGKIMIDNSKAIQELDETEKKAEEAAKSLEELSAQASEMALTIGAAAAAFVAGIGVKAVMAADDLKKSMNLLQAQTGATDAEMKQFKDSATALYNEGVGQNFEDIARAMSEVARTTGLSGEELKKTTKNALALRDTFEFDVRASADTANSLMKQFGISADEAYTLMAQGAQQGANKNGDLLDVMSEYSVQFKSLGFSAEQFTDVLIQGANEGAFKIDVVGDAMKEFNIVSKDGSKASAAAFEGLGLNAEQMTKAFATGGDTAQKAFTEVMKRLAAIEDPVKKNTIGVGLFRTKYEDLEAGAIAALGNIEAKTNQNADTLDKINKVKYDSVGEAFAALWRNIETGFFIPLGEKMIPAIEGLIQTFKENGPAIKETFGGAIEGLAAIFNGLIKSVEFVVKHFKTFSAVLAGVTAMMVAQFVIGTLIPMYKAWRATTVGMTLAQAALNAVMAMNPFSWIAIAIGAAIAAIVLLIMNWDSVVKYLRKAWKWISDIFDKSLNWLVSTTKKQFKAMLDGIVGTWQSIKNAARSVWDWIMNFFQTSIGRIVAILGGPVTIGLALIANWQTIKDKAISIWNSVVGFFQTAIDKIKSIFSSLRASMISVFSGIWDFIKAPINLIINGLNLFIKGFQNLINNVVSAINSIPDIKIPGIGEIGIPELKKVNFDGIPQLAEGGTITRAGTVMVGEQGPEFLNLPRGAEVVPLDKQQQQQTVVVNIHNPKIFNERDAEKLGDLLVRSLKLKGIQPRGV